MILPLSGAAADYGQSIQNSISLAKEDQPEIFTKIKFITEDAQHDVKLAISAFKKLVELDKVDLIYTWGVPFCKGLAPIAEAQKIPLVGQCINQDSTRGRKYVLRFMNYTDEYLLAQVKDLYNKKFERLGIVLADHPYLEEMYEALMRTLVDGQSVKVVDKFLIDNFNFRSTISKVKASNYDAIGVFLYAGQISQFYKQLAEQKLDIPTFGTNFFESLSEINSAGKTMDGAVFANNLARAEYIERYQDKYNSVSQIGFGALGYEFAVLTGKLFNNTPNKLSADQIVAKYTSSGVQGGTAAGPYEFKNIEEAGQYAYFPIAIKRIEAQKFNIEKIY